jgi:hypothetical protein
MKQKAYREYIAVKRQMIQLKLTPEYLRIVQQRRK